eukprot:jgi/Psemu1/26459/gm1.26459_g
MKDHDGSPPAKKRHQFQPTSKVALSVTPQHILPIADATKLHASLSKPNKGQNGVQGGSAEEKKKGKSETQSEVSQKVVPAKKRRQSKHPSNAAPLVTPRNDVPQAAATKLHTGSSKPNKGQTDVQDGSAEGKKKGKSKSQSEVLRHVPGLDLHQYAESLPAKKTRQSKAPSKGAVSVGPQHAAPPHSTSTKQGASVPITIQEDLNYREYLNSVENIL